MGNPKKKKNSTPPFSSKTDPQNWANGKGQIDCKLSRGGGDNKKIPTEFESKHVKIW